MSGAYACRICGAEGADGVLFPLCPNCLALREEGMVAVVVLSTSIPHDRVRVDWMPRAVAIRLFGEDVAPVEYVYDNNNNA